MQEYRFIVRGGCGDAWPILNRIQKFVIDNNVKAHLTICGYKNIPSLIKPVIDMQPYIASCNVINNFNNLALLPQIVDAIHKQHPEAIVQVFDVMDVLKYGKANFEDMELQYPWMPIVQTLSDNFMHRSYVNEEPAIKLCGIQLATKSGSDDYDHFGARFLPKAEWIKLINMLRGNNIEPVFFGTKEDNLGLNVEEYGISMLGKLTIAETMALIQEMDYFVGTNSWMWSISAISGKPTICTYFTNKFWAKLQIPKNEEEFFKHCYIFYERKECNAEEMFKQLKLLT